MGKENSRTRSREQFLRRDRTWYAIQDQMLKSFWGHNYFDCKGPINAGKKIFLMPLKSCYECNKEISTKAIACPQCGAPQTKGPFGKQVLYSIALCTRFYSGIYFIPIGPRGGLKLPAAPRLQLPISFVAWFIFLDLLYGINFIFQTSINN